MNSILIGLVIILIFVIFGLPYIFIHCHVYLPKYKNYVDPSKYNIEYEVINVKTEDGINLNGWYMPNKENKGTVLVCHGVGANKADVIQVSVDLYKAGYNVYEFDFRGHGDSDSAKITYGYDERKDIKAMVQYIKEHGADEIGIYGLSMGAAIVMQSLPYNPEIKVAIIDSGFASAEKVMNYRIGMAIPEPVIPVLGSMAKFYTKTFFGVSIDEIAPIEVIDKVHIPILFIVGDSDTNITPDNGTMLYEKANDPKELFVAKGVNHRQTINYPGFDKVIVAFMDKYLLDKAFDPELEPENKE